VLPVYCTLVGLLHKRKYSFKARILNILKAAQEFKPKNGGLDPVARRDPKTKKKLKCVVFFFRTAFCSLGRRRYSVIVL